MFGKVPLASARRSAAADFWSAADFTATLCILRCAYRFQWRKPCLRYLCGVTGAAAAFGAPESSAPAAACDGRLKKTKSPVARTKAERPPALTIIWQSPHFDFASPQSEMRPPGMTAAGQKRGIFGQVRRNRGNAASNPFSDRAFAERLRRKGGLCQPGRSVL